MKALHLLSLVLLATAPTPTEVVVREGESLQQVAERALGDARGASELKALNGLKDEKLTPGAKLKLPGTQRHKARNGLDSAWHAVEQTDKDKVGPRREEAFGRLREAEGLFQGARYEEALKLADEAWHLVMKARSSAPASFSVEVAPDGKTRVTANDSLLQVEDHQGGSRRLEPREELVVMKGEPLPPPLPIPEPMDPTDMRRLSLHPTRGGLGPVKLAWKAVDNAERYELELLPEQGERRVLTVSAPRASLPLPAGRYRWNVRALIRGARSGPSVTRQFDVVENPIKLEVKGSSWK